MPFGYANASGIYQCAIEKALGPTEETKVFMYLDDVMVATENVHKGLELLNELLQKQDYSLNYKNAHFSLLDSNILVRPSSCKVKTLTD